MPDQFQDVPFIVKAWNIKSKPHHFVCPNCPISHDLLVHPGKYMDNCAILSTTNAIPIAIPMLDGESVKAINNGEPIPIHML
ncbi:MAG: hypothetical protein FWG18_04105, partial [Alphaproteobacteria bacterium]|nr:hypothetical protein [Alphaproteobacteria bacterium]